ncbi:MAG: hypothetical protein LBE56_00755 [Tannerella sp.]|jgi:hypothetical protein|nr:hypothetical protein [Tannerella sp.]
MNIKNELPEYVAGIATAKSAAAQRRAIIHNEYMRLLETLQRKRKKKAVFNDFLAVDVYITMHESGKKASYTSAFNWQSTYAVKHLEKIIKYAKQRAGEPIYYSPKNTGKQKEFNYINMAKLYYDFTDYEYDYLNFTVKLILGIKSDGRHIQYSVNKIDIEKEKTS